MINNGAFYCYIMNQIELDKIVDRICNGETQILSNSWLTSDDLKYIEEEVERRLGVPCDLSL